MSDKITDMQTQEATRLEASFAEDDVPAPSEGPLFEAKNRHHEIDLDIGGRQGFPTNTARVLPSPHTPGTASSRLRLEFLDGLRGLAALYVVLFHASWQFPQYVSQLSPFAQACLALTQYGHYAVDVFIVLSGYCLMLPVARSKEGRLRGGIREYFKRRALRILPTYYTALALSVIILPSPMLLSSALRLVEHRPLVNIAASAGWNAAWAHELCRHLLMIQNLPPKMSFINPPMWSVALEWQIYFLLPLLLLPLWRRFGIIPCIFAACVLGVLPHILLPQKDNFDWTCPWMLGLFAMGMGGAVITAAWERDAPSHSLISFPWGRVGGLLTAVFIAACILRLSWITPASRLGPGTALWASDFWVGAATVCVILHCARAALVSRFRGAPMREYKTPVLRLLEAKWALRIGTFSYSLYLIHAPIILVLKGVIGVNLHFAGARAVGLECITSLVVSLFAAYALYILVERRFLPGRPRTERQVIAATVREPAI